MCLVKKELECCTEPPITTSLITQRSQVGNILENVPSIGITLTLCGNIAPASIICLSGDHFLA